MEQLHNFINGEPYYLADNLSLLRRSADMSYPYVRVLILDVASRDSERRQKLHGGNIRSLLESVFI